MCVASVAQAQQGVPLSAIDWLHQTPHAAARPVVQPAAPRRPPEPRTAQSGTAPKVSVAPLETGAQRRLGLLPRARTGLPPDLWRGASPDTLIAALNRIGTPRLPAAQSLLLTLLSAEADDLPGPRAAERWTLARIDSLARLGAVPEALALTLQASPRTAPALFDRWLSLSLLSDGEGAACDALNTSPALAPGEVARIYCLARGGDFDTAALLFGTTAAIDDFDTRNEALLARYLDPDLDHDPLPRAPVRPDTLTFRLYEAAGAPLSVTALPRPFAHAGLRPQMGWKTQLESAERLARAGVMDADRLMALYADRKPAASGGIWDRVSAIQGFDRAAEAGDMAEIARRLPALWRGLRAGGLEVPMAAWFAPLLTPAELPPAAAEIAWHLQLLSPAYKTARAPAPLAAGFLASLASGAPDAEKAHTALDRAILRGFRTSSTPDTTASGAALLDIVDLLDSGADGDMDALTRALSGLRAQGLEDIATRAALQILILRAPL